MKKIHGIDCRITDARWFTVLEEVLSQIQGRAPDDYEEILGKLVSIRPLPKSCRHYVDGSGGIFVTFLDAETTYRYPRYLVGGYIKIMRTYGTEYCKTKRVVMFRECLIEKQPSRTSYVVAHEFGHVATRDGERDYLIDQQIVRPETLDEYNRNQCEELVERFDEYLADMYAQKWGYLHKGRNPSQKITPPIIPKDS